MTLLHTVGASFSSNSNNMPLSETGISLLSIVERVDHVPA